MICQKCGKQNQPSAVNCAFCGTAMPERAKCGGFADILSFEPKETVKSAPAPAAQKSDMNCINQEQYDQDIAQLKKELKASELRVRKSAKRGATALIVAILSLALSLTIVGHGILSQEPEEKEKSDKPKTVESNDVRAPVTPDTPDNNTIQQIENQIKDYEADIDGIYQSYVNDSKETTIDKMIQEIFPGDATVPDYDGIKNTIEGKINPEIEEISELINNGKKIKADIDKITNHEEKTNLNSKIGGQINRIKEIQEKAQASIDDLTKKIQEDVLNEDKKNDLIKLIKTLEDDDTREQQNP